MKAAFVSSKLASRKFRAFCLLVLLVTLSIVEYAHSYQCGHDQIHKSRNLQSREKLYHNDNPEGKANRFLQSEFQPIRITVDYYNIENFSGISSTYVSNTKKIVDAAVELFTKIVKVRPLSLPIRVQRCNVGVDFNIKDEIKNDGVQTDLLLFAVIDDDPATRDTVEGWATFCYQDTTTNRPVVGVIGLSRVAVTFTKDNWLEYYTYLLFHEIIHVLGFNESLYAEFYDASRDNSIPKGEVLIEGANINGLPRNLIKTPNVMEAARNHFDCSSILGVELENQGGSGSAGSHWESRVMLGDIMIAVSYDELFLSGITCAFLEDTGWYQIDCYNGGLFKFGKNKGCEFVAEKCIQNQQTPFSNQFCHINRQNLCMVGDKSKGICSIKSQTGNQGDEIQEETHYQYFGNDSTGGFYFADFCPVVNSFTDSARFFSGSCINGLATLPPEMQESISNNSGCLMSNLINTSINDQTKLDIKLPVCYKYDCDFSTTSVIVYLGEEKVSCPGTGGTLKVDGYTGELICPEFNDYCSGTVECSSIADCIHKSSTEAKAVTVKSSTNTDVVNTESSAGTTNANSSEIEDNNTTTTETTTDNGNGTGTSGGRSLTLSYFLILLAAMAGA